MNEVEELETWREVGRRLWPFVRPWGLCGGHPEAIAAAEVLAGLIGVTPSAVVDANTELLTRKQTLEAIAQHFEQRWFRKMTRGDSEAFLQELRNL